MGISGISFCCSEIIPFLITRHQSWCTRRYVLSPHECVAANVCISDLESLRSVRSSRVGFLNSDNDECGNVGDDLDVSFSEH